MSLRYCLALITWAGLSCFSLPAIATEAEQDEVAVPAPTAASPNPLLDLPLEDLLILESTSVAKKRQRVADSAAAVYVITQEDIRRSAAKTIPDLLRGVPGVEVTQMATGSYAVTIRGFNSLLASSVLVMIDGRSAYVSTFSGVFWEQMLIPLGDIERIEIVRGPGATLWGANAVNGVINIITRHSADAQGATANGRIGMRSQEFALSYGGLLSDNLSYRLFANVRHEQGLVFANGKDTGPGLSGAMGGGRIDWEASDRDTVTVQGDYVDGHMTEPQATFNGDLLAPANILRDNHSDFSTANILARWTRKQASDFDWSLQLYHSRVARSGFGIGLKWHLTDFDWGLHWKADDVHDINFGVGARLMHDNTKPSPIFRLKDPIRTDRWLSGYVQDDISLVPDRLRLTIGTKLEHNNFTGFEVQPGVRLFGRVNKGLSLWAAVSRAVRTPSRFERSADIVLSLIPADAPDNSIGLPLYPILRGVASHESDRLIAYEAGIRAALAPNWSIDIAGYYNEYSRLATVDAVGGAPIFVPPLTAPVGFTLELALNSRGKARTFGVETLLKGEIAPWWHVEASWSHFDYEMSRDPLSGQPFTLIFPLSFSPRDQFALRNQFEISDRLAISSQMQRISHLPGAGVPAYTEASVRATWQPVEGLDISLVGENLLHARHVEFAQPRYPAPKSYVPRQVTAELRFRF